MMFGCVMVLGGNRLCAYRHSSMQCLVTTVNTSHHNLATRDVAFHGCFEVETQSHKQLFSTGDDTSTHGTVPQRRVTTTCGADAHMKTGG